MAVFAGNTENRLFFTERISITHKPYGTIKILNELNLSSRTLNEISNDSVETPGRRSLSACPQKATTKAKCRASRLERAAKRV